MFALKIIEKDRHEWTVESTFESAAAASKWAAENLAPWKVWKIVRV